MRDDRNDVETDVFKKREDQNELYFFLVSEIANIVVHLQRLLDTCPCEHVYNVHINMCLLTKRFADKIFTIYVQCT